MRLTSRAASTPFSPTRLLKLAWIPLYSGMTARVGSVALFADVASAQPRDRDRGPSPGYDRGPPDRGPPDRGPPGRGPDRGRERWDLLGEQSVGFDVDRDVIRVGRREGRFSALALEVRDNDVEILDLNVFFNRGPPQSLRVREFIRAGGRTRPIDFAWGDRSIDRAAASASAAAVSALGGAGLQQGRLSCPTRTRSASAAAKEGGRVRPARYGYRAHLSLASELPRPRATAVRRGRSICVAVAAPSTASSSTISLSRASRARPRSASSDAKSKRDRKNEEPRCKAGLFFSSSLHPPP
jgi:hypothetical protein